MAAIDDIQVEATLKDLRRFLALSKTKIGGLFHEMDANDDGTVSYRELREALEARGFELPWSSWNLLCQRFDDDGDGNVNYRELAQELSRARAKPREYGQDEYEANLRKAVSSFY